MAFPEENRSLYSEFSRDDSKQHSQMEKPISGKMRTLLSTLETKPYIDKMTQYHKSPKSIQAFKERVARIQEILTGTPAITTLREFERQWIPTKWAQS